ncbi:hypothetical protein GCM10009839_12910 [Catenulispora yoronensis]|uniref:SnoaL-like domain-containing protein n=1 Tax=Catenulispora yoronensis TaxID=450799 RepID=A0ABN2TRQ7_9ACTN
MTDTSHAETVRRGYDFIDAGRFDDFLACFHDDVRYVRQGVGDLRGLAAMSRFYKHDRPIASGKHELEKIISDGPWVAVRGRFVGTLKDGTEADFPFTDWVHFRGDLIDLRETLFPAR